MGEGWGVGCSFPAVVLSWEDYMPLECGVSWGDGLPSLSLKLASLAKCEDKSSDHLSVRLEGGVGA